eukprot:TRINITY_DN678_c0_g1_i1.p1 TRINITY_DN678_c0_g1~~TRINITY_DN678_c0_g1_i1.p1  ORF type:complete len:908 (+),score=354.07 TRINITY_DN678_c0_g1_i1:102-2726(+)
MGCASSVGENQQLVITDFSGRRSVRNGPGIICTGCVSSKTVRDAVMLGQGEYARIENDEDGTRCIVVGPQVHFLGPRDRVINRHRLPVLAKAQYCKVRDEKTGEVRVANGPAVVRLGPFETLQGGVADCPVLQEGQYCRVQDEATGDIRVMHGPAVVPLGEHEELLDGVQEMPVLRQAQYCKVRDQRTGDVRVEHGPQVVRIGPHEQLVDGGVRQSPVLRKSEYCVVRDLETGRLRAEVGPCVVALAALEELAQGAAPLPVLKRGEFVKVKNTEDGQVRIEKGPQVVKLGAYDQLLGGGVRRLPVLQCGEYCRYANEEEGLVAVAHGPCVVDLGAHDEVIAEEGCPDGVRRCPDLSGDEYLVVRDDSDGTMRNVVGPQVFRPGPFDAFGRPQKIINLQRNEYVRIRDAAGGLRVERGERRLVPDPLDTVAAGVERAVNVDEHHAVTVRNVDSGKLELVTAHGLFFPSAYQEIVEVQERIVLEPYETVVCKDPSGVFYYASGDPSLLQCRSLVRVVDRTGSLEAAGPGGALLVASQGEQSPGACFFLPPHHQLVKQSWSTDLRKERATSEMVWKFDSRPSYMNYEFSCRTLDNVELVVDIYFFWRIIDVRAMVHSTADAPGDTCTHARSMIMQQISKIKLMEFLERFNEVVRSACLEDPFYAERGIELMSAEVLRFECSSAETNQILREIIQETCDRLKRTERQRGENEVAMERLTGEIAEERKRQELVEVRKSHLRVEARIEGEAEGTRIAAFLSKLAKYDGEDGFSMGPERAMEVFELLRRYEADARLSADKRKAVEALGRGTAQLYVMPDDVSLHFGTLQHPVKPAAPCPAADSDCRPPPLPIRADPTAAALGAPGSDDGEPRIVPAGQRRQ